MKRFVYFYFNRHAPEQVKAVVPAHVRYWQTARLADYQGGPFGDRSGGLISFAAPDLQQPTDIVLRDPFILEDLVDARWIKEWIPE
jgi:uncharacterized protein YciI